MSQNEAKPLGLTQLKSGVDLAGDKYRFFAIGKVSTFAVSRFQAVIPSSSA
jgi:hypothetical protein